jgi:hypothetical protein
LRRTLTTGVKTHIAEYSLRKRIAVRSALPTASPTPQIVPNSLPEPVINERSALLDRKSPSPSPSLLFSKLNNRDTVSIIRTRVLLAISYASFSGILSGMCLLFAKSGVELLLLTLSGKNQFWRWESWGLVLGLVIFALLQLWYLHKALILANPTLVCPCECF